MVAPRRRLEASAGAAPGRRTGRPGRSVHAQDSVSLQPRLEASAGPARALRNGRPGPCVPKQDSVTQQPWLEASAGPAWARRTGRPSPCVPHRTRSHCRCGWWPVQDQLRLAGLVTRTPACPHRTRPPPQLWLEHAEGAGPGRRTAQTGPCGPAQHSVTLKPQLAPSAGPARALRNGQPGPCVPPPDSATSAAAAGAC